MSAPPLHPRIHTPAAVPAAHGLPHPVVFANSPRDTPHQDAFSLSNGHQLWDLDDRSNDPSADNALGLFSTNNETSGTGSVEVDDHGTSHSRRRTGNAGFISPRRYQLIFKERQQLQALVRALQADNENLKKEVASANEKANGLRQLLKEVDVKLKQEVRDGKERTSTLQASLKEAQVEIKARMTQEEALANRLLNVETILAATRHRYAQTCLAGSRENTRANTLFQESSNSKFPEDMYIKAVFEPLKWPLVEINDNHLDSTDLALLPA